MKENKPYIDFMFLGVKSFTDLLTEGNAEFKLNESGLADKLYETKSDFFKKNQDTIKVGWCTRDGIERYFAEFGLKITDNFESYLIFIYEKEPTIEDLNLTVDDMEGIVNQQLDNVDINTIAEQLKKQ